MASVDFTSSEEIWLLKEREGRKRIAGRKCLADQAYEITMLVVSIVVYLMTGTVFYFVFEGWPLFESFYFCVVTMTVRRSAEHVGLS